MTIVVEFTQTNTIEPGPLYKVLNVVNYVQNIEKEIFVHDTETDTFQHVASLWDMNNIPNSKQAAITADSDYYRSDTAYKSYSSIPSAGSFETYTYGRVVSLVQDYAEAAGDFPGEVRRIVSE